ncbi:MAG: ketopantoate reductase family protein [Anaerolineales bacterium]|nr:ketopantoate reductase family protein [Anaerolineales bacterium]MCB8950998.1 ketopantoate reductase family protein [Ardenticatenales bacterium]
MKILVFGAGAVGSYLGAKLMEAGHAVTLVCRPLAAEAITHHGLTIMPTKDAERPVAVHPRVVTSLRQAMMPEPQYDLVIPAMKSYDVDTAINELAAFYPQVPWLLTVQNGIGLEEKFMGQFGAQRVVAGSVTIPLNLQAANVIKPERSDRGVAVAPVRQGQDVRQWRDLLQTAGINCVLTPDHRTLKWSKALLNMVGNATAAILNRHPRIVYDYRPTFELEVAMLKEALAVMKKQGIRSIDLPGSPTRKLAWAVRYLPRELLQPLLARAVGSGRGNKLPSFQIDLNAGKTVNEVLYHNGAVAQVGKTLGIPTPVNAALTSVLLRLARGELEREAFSGSPKALLRAVQRFRQQEEGEANARG